jgi:3-phenylpropionate/trans-cinnamate dioxygenase ferredoxin component
MSQWVRACDVHDIEPEDVIPFRHSGVDYAVYRSPDGKFFATAGNCTHQRALLCEGLVVGRSIECPKHNGRFDYTTGIACGAPAITDLQTYEVMVSGSIVYVDVEPQTIDAVV